MSKQNKIIFTSQTSKFGKMQ